MDAGTGVAAMTESWYQSAMSPNHQLREIISAQEVDQRLAELGRQIAADYADRDPVFVVIAEGARRFAQRLIEEVEPQGVKPKTVVVRARRTSGTRLNQVELEPVPEGVFARCDVLILDDIADEGRTMEAVLARVRCEAPNSVSIAVLVSKLARRLVDLQLDYVGFELKDGWVVGYGMDLDEAFRDQDALSIVEPAS